MLKNNTKKIVSVVTGANGFVGSHLVEYLLKQGHTVRCVVRKSSNLKWLKGLNIDIQTCGLEDVKALKLVMENANYVFHVAGAVNRKNYEAYYKGNVVLTENVLKACEEIDSIQKIILTSSLAASAPASLNQPVNEETPPQTISLYGRSKVAMEQLVQKKYPHLPYVIIRPPAVYGERDTAVLTLFQMANRGWFTKVGFKDKQASLVYVKDLAQGFFLAATCNKALQQTYFITSDTMPTWTEIGKTMSEALGKKVRQIALPHALVFVLGNLLEIIGKLQGKPATINREKAKEITQEAWTCSAKKAEIELGYKSQYNMNKGFPITVQWYKKQTWL